MAQYTIAAAEVKPLANAKLDKDSLSGAAITAGQTVYKDGNGKWQLAQADGTAAEAAVRGVAVNSTSAADQPLAVAIEGDVQLDTGALAGAAVGDIAVLGAAAGGMYPSGDLVSTNRVAIVGFIKTSTTPAVITLNPIATGLVKA